MSEPWLTLWKINLWAIKRLMSLQLQLERINQSKGIKFPIPRLRVDEDRRNDYGVPVPPDKPEPQRFGIY